MQDLAARALAVTADPELRLTARHDAGWALAWSGRRTAALSALISVAEEASRDLPALAWDALAECSHCRLPVRNARQPPGRQPRPRPAGTPGSAASRPGPGH